VGHVPYLVNLASSNNELRKRSIHRLTIEIKRAENFGVSYLVLHPGTNQNKKEGIRLIAEGLNEVLDQFNNLNTKILLETVAGEGNKIGSRLEELANILEKVNKVNYCGVCLDTCHVFAAGYNIRGYEGYHKFLKKFDEVIGLSRIKVIHINDSKARLGSRTDRHAPIGEGLLGLQVFHAIVRDNRFKRIPKILEIPERDTKSKSNLEILRKLKERERPIIEKIPKQLTLEGFKDVF
jgi:deoxyribonuclease-4